MKLIISGDRKFNNYLTFCEKLEDLIKRNSWRVTEIVHGGARGVDSLADRWAKDNNIPVTVKSAEWDNLKQDGAIIKERTNPWTKKIEKYNANAGFFRNKMLAEYGDVLVAFQIDGDTPGTQHMIKQAKERGIEVHIVGQEEKTFKFDF